MLRERERVVRPAISMFWMTRQERTSAEQIYPTWGLSAPPVELSGEVMILPYEVSRPNPARLEFGWERYYRDVEDFPPLQGEEPIDRGGDTYYDPLPLQRHGFPPPCPSFP